MQTKDSKGEYLYGTHSLRRGGCVMLSLSGWSVQMIQKWGRWASACIFKYVMEAPLVYLGESVTRIFDCVRPDGKVDMVKELQQTEREFQAV